MPFFRQNTAILVLAFCLGVIGQNSANASEDFKEDELLMSFTYPSVGRVFVLSIYDHDSRQMYLPVTEVFRMLGINMKVDRISGTISGIYLLGGKQYLIDFSELRVKVGNSERAYSAGEMEQREMDYYMTLNVFEDMFGMVFTYNMNNLSISLETTHIMPVVDKVRREEARKRIQQLNLGQTFYPLEYNRERSVFRAGFLDYNIGVASSMEELQQDYNFQLVGGIEALGGELRVSNSFGHSADLGWFNRYGNVNWRYSVRDLNTFSSVQLGQLSTRGLQSQQINGFAITNNPIEPMQLYGQSVFDGTTQPDSEVELYLNNELIDFTVSDAQGYFRFNVPLRYGTTNMRTQVYTRDGRLLVNEKAILVPFNFVPEGRLIYNIQGGYVFNDGNFRNYGESRAANADVSYGISNWLTTKAGMEFNDVDLERPTVYGSATARLFQEYLLNVDLAPNFFYRAQSSAVFSSNHSYSVAFTYYEGMSRYNVRGAEYQFQANVYSPLPFRFLNSGIRLSIDHAKLSGLGETRFRSDIFSQLGPVNLRVNYSDRLLLSHSGYDLIGGLFSGSLTYQFNRRSGFHMLNGSFLRGTVMYNRLLKSVQQYDIQLSRAVMGTGQFLIGFTRLTASSQSFLQVGLSIDMGGKMRSATTGRSNFRSTNIVQNFRGSVGYDDHFNALHVIDRQQVGRAGASIVLFIDNDNDGRFSEEDEIIPYAALKLDRPALMRVEKDGIIRLSQLLGNFRYNIEIDRSMIPNPLFVPEKDKFSFVADPNQFKVIEIPFYRSGVIEGSVFTKKGDKQEGIGGLRLQIQGKDSEYVNNIRTFRGGSFYAMDVPPGQYYVLVDTMQTDYLGAPRANGRLDFEVKATPSGDYVNDLKLILNIAPDRVDPPTQKIQITAVSFPSDTTPGIQICHDIYESGIRRYAMNSQKSYILRFGEFKSFREAGEQLEKLRSVHGNTTKLYTIYDFKSRLFWNITAPVKEKADLIPQNNTFTAVSDRIIVEVLNRHSTDGWLSQNCYPELEDAYYIQIAAFKDRKRAYNYIDQVYPTFDHFLAETGSSIRVVIKEDHEFYKVLIGPVDSLETARLLLARFPDGFSDAFIRSNQGVRK